MSVPWQTHRLRGELLHFKSVVLGTGRKLCCSSLGEGTSGERVESETVGCVFHAPVSIEGKSIGTENTPQSTRCVFIFLYIRPLKGLPCPLWYPLLTAFYISIVSWLPNRVLWPKSVELYIDMVVLGGQERLVAAILCDLTYVCHTGLM